MAVVFRGVHKLKNKFHAVAVLEGAVLVEQIEAHRGLRRGFKLCRGKQYLAVEVFPHTLEYRYEAHSAAVDNAGFLQDGEHFGGHRKGLLHFGYVHRKQLLNAG